MYTIVHLLLEEFRIFLKSSLRTQSVCHTISSRIGVRVHVFIRAGVRVKVQSPKFSNPGDGVGADKKQGMSGWWAYYEIKYCQISTDKPVSSLNCDKPLCSGIRVPESVVSTGGQITDSVKPFAAQWSL